MDTRNSCYHNCVSIIILTSIFFQITACSGFQATAEIFRPPTAEADIPTQLNPINAAPFEIPSPTNTQTTNEINCTNSLHYIEDLTVPDGTTIAPGSEIDKQWQVENNGSCNWDQLYSFRRISGDELGTAPTQDLFPARSGSKVVIEIMLTAPLQAGSYHAVWQAFDPYDQPFGDYLSIYFVVSP